MVATTSIENYHEHKRSGKLGQQAANVLEFIERHPHRDWTRAEIAQALHLPLSSVCGRVNELIKARLLIPAPNRPCHISGKKVCPIRQSTNYESESKTCH
jgi:hypothetical protein